MGLDVSSVKGIGKIVMFLLFIAGVALLIIPILVGVGEQSATALSVNTGNTYGNLTAAMESTAATTASVFSFLPWLGVGLVVAGAFGLGKML